MLAEQGHELWIGHASEIRAGVVRKQKTDARDAAHLLRLLLEKRFPRIWIPSPVERDARQLLRHRYKLVCFRVSVKNQLHGRVAHPFDFFQSTRTHGWMIPLQYVNFEGLIWLLRVPDSSRSWKGRGFGVLFTAWD